MTPLAGGEILMPFPWALAQSEMQTASSKIWTWVADPIFSDDNHYTKSASNVVTLATSALCCKHVLTPMDICYVLIRVPLMHPSVLELVQWWIYIRVSPKAWTIMGRFASLITFLFFILNIISYWNILFSKSPFSYNKLKLFSNVEGTSSLREFDFHWVPYTSDFMPI